MVLQSWFLWLSSVAVVLWADSVRCRGITLEFLICSCPGLMYSQTIFFHYQFCFSPLFSFTYMNIDINIRNGVSEFSEINVLEKSILHGKSPRAKYRFEILSMFKYINTFFTQLRLIDNYFSCGFFWFRKYACVICTSVFMLGSKLRCVVCVRNTCVFWCSFSITIGVITPTRVLVCMLCFCVCMASVVVLSSAWWLCCRWCGWAHVSDVLVLCSYIVPVVC